MTLAGRYKIGRLLRMGEITSVEAEDLSSGVAVYAHFVDEAFLAKVRDLAQQEPCPGLEVGEDCERSFVITAARAEYEDLPGWVRGRLAASPNAWPTRTSAGLRLVCI